MNYRGFEINDDEEGYRVEQTYHHYNTVKETEAAIDLIIEKQEARKPFIQEGWEQVFDKDRGECIRIDGKLHGIRQVTNVKSIGAGNEYLLEKEYFAIDNPYGSEFLTPEFMRVMFSDRLYDAIRCIREDKGDLILAGNVLGGRNLQVIRFLDRSVGERARQEVLKGFENSEFFTCLKVYFSGGMWGSEFQIGENDRPINGTWALKYEQPLRFETETAAWEYAQKLTKKINEQFDLLKDNKELKEQWLEDLDVHQMTVIQEAVLKLLEAEEQEHKGTPFNFEVIQDLVRD